MSTTTPEPEPEPELKTETEMESDAEDDGCVAMPYPLPPAAACIECGQTIAYPLQGVSYILGAWLLMGGDGSSIDCELLLLRRPPAGDPSPRAGKVCDKCLDVLREPTHSIRLGRTTINAYDALPSLEILLLFLARYGSSKASRALDLILKHEYGAQRGPDPFAMFRLGAVREINTDSLPAEDLAFLKSDAALPVDLPSAEECEAAEAEAEAEAEASAAAAVAE